MKIKVWKCYDGNQAKRPIEEGVYDESSRKLFGLARYLIDNGNAIEIIEEAPAQAAENDVEHEKLACELTVENDKIRAAAKVVDMSDIVAAIKTEEEVSEKPIRKRKGKR